MKHGIKIRKGLAGLVAGLIAAIALLVIALPVMMQYQQHITKSYQIKEYATMLEEQKELEEKGLAACYEPSEGIITINNTLGRPVRIVMAYATDGTNEEVKYYQPPKEIAPGNNTLHVRYDLGFNLNSGEIKTIKLVTTRGATIQPPYCKEIVKVVTYEQVIQYIVRRLQGFPVNVYLGEEQIPTGISPVLYGSIFAHGYLDILSNGTVYMVNGTTVNRITFKFENWDDLLAFLDNVITGKGYGYSFYLYVREYLTPLLTLKRYEVGDSIAMIVDAQTASYDADNEGCYNLACAYWTTSEYFYSEETQFVIKRIAINYVTKIADSDAQTLTYNPIEYLLVNSGYDYIVVGLECEKFDPIDENINTFNFSGEIYLAYSDSPPTDVEDSALKIVFDIEYSVEGSRVSVEKIYAEVFKKENQDWHTLGEPGILYRDGYSLIFEDIAVYREFKMIDQIAFIINKSIVNELGVKPGDNLWVSAKGTFVIDGSSVYEDVYGTNEQEWYKYTYTPLKSIIDAWYEEYFGG